VAQSATQVIVATDVVDSTQLAGAVADASVLWARHDRAARELVRVHGGREIGRTDGIVALFDAIGPALRFAAAYHEALGRMDRPLCARVGVAAGPVALRENARDDVALGAVPFEVDGPVLPIAMRLQSLCRGGQTLISSVALTGPAQRGLHAHGFWRLKGVPEPIEVFESLRPGQAPQRPVDAEKAHQVERVDGDWQAVDVGRQRLPRMHGSFVGRDALLREIGARLDAGETPVTLLGTGGVGKTRLALQFARFGPTYFEGGVWFCDLAAATDEDGVLQAAAQGLAVPLAGTDPVATLGHALAGRGRCLVIVDNAERAVAGLATVLARWRQAAPSAALLVTSRIALGVPGESMIEVGPLLPWEACLLYEQRMQQASVCLDEAETTRIPALVDALDRLPLALELSAVRTTSMTPTLQIEHMRERRRWLRATAAPAGRHGTLTEVFEASWQLLSTDEKSALAQCTVFEGGFTLEAAGRIVQTTAPWVGDVLAALMAKSLLQRRDGGRLGLLQTVRDEARARDDAQPAREQAIARHSRTFASLDEGHLWSAGFADLDNLIAACEQATQRGEAEVAAAALGLCAELLLVRGPVRRLQTLAESFLALRGLAPAWRAEGLRVLGNALYALGRREDAVERYRQGLQLAESGSDRGLRIRLACALSTPWSRSGRTAEAEALLRQRDPDDAALGDPVRSCALANAKGAVAMAAQRLPEAVAHFERALQQAMTASHRRWEGGIRGNLGGALYLSGRQHEARHHFETALAIALNIGDLAWAANAQCNLGLLLLEAHDRETSRRLLGDALCRAREIGQVLLEATAGCNLGLLQIDDGQPGQAVGLLQDAAACAMRMADHGLAAQCEQALSRALQALAEWPAAAAAAERAIALAGQANDATECARGWLRRAEVAAASGSDPDGLARACAEAHTAIAALPAAQGAALQPQLEAVGRAAISSRC
jgi:predicted ATPase